MNKPDAMMLTPAVSDAEHPLTDAIRIQQEPPIGPRWRSLGRAGIGAWLIISGKALLAPEPVHAWSTGGYRSDSSYGDSHHRSSHSNHRSRSPRTDQHHSGSHG